MRLFLEAHDFYIKSKHGDDVVYWRKGHKMTVKISDKDGDSIPNGTMSYIKKCIRQCGISNKQILRWWKDNGFGD